MSFKFVDTSTPLTGEMEPIALALTSDQEQKIRELAALFFSPKEIAIIMQLPVEAFCKACKKENSPAYKAFLAGRLQEEALVRKSIVDFAKKGSTPAQTMALDLIKLSAAKMIDR
jgi:hypothetical protein